MKKQNRVNNPKIKIAQLFCRHKNKGWYTRQSTFHNLQGQTQYLICEDCGKELKTQFIKYD